MDTPSLQEFHRARQRFVDMPKVIDRADYERAIDLSTGSPAFEPPKELMRAVVASMIMDGDSLFPKMHHYSRQEVPAHYYEEFLHNENIMHPTLGLSRENLVYGNGVTHLFSVAMRTLVGEKDCVVLPTPTYGHFAVYSGLDKDHLAFLPMQEEHGFKLTPQTLDAGLKQQEAEHPQGHIWLVLINPHNPTGAVYSQEEINALADVLRKPEHQKVNIIQDMVYKDTEYDKGKPAGSLAMLPDFAYQRTVTFLGPAKAFGLVGMRAGIAVGDESLIAPMREAIERQQEYISLPSQLTTAFVCNPEVRESGVFLDGKAPPLKQYLEEVATHYQARRALWKDMVEGNAALPDYPELLLDKETVEAAQAQAGRGIPNVKTLGDPESGFFQPLDFTAYKGTYYGEKKIETDSDLAELLWEHQRVLTLPGQCMLYPKEKLVLRTSFSLEPEKLIEAGGRIAEFVQQLKDHPYALPEKQPQVTR